MIEIKFQVEIKLQLIKTFKHSQFELQATLVLVCNEEVYNCGEEKGLLSFIHSAP